MTVLSSLRVFATHPHPCSYLDDREATTLFIDPNAEIDALLYSQLSALGFRRSGGYLYRPHCRDCQACIPARIPVEQFCPDRRQRRILRANADLTVTRVLDISSDEYYALYARYIESRHNDGDMYPPSREQYASFLTREWGVTTFQAFHMQGKLLAVAVVDMMENGLSAIYTFYDPAEARRSLGTYAVLWQIEECQRLGLPHVYLGYWIKECRKMSYKSSYRPLELFLDNCWVKADV